MSAGPPAQRNDGKPGDDGGPSDPQTINIENLSYTASDIDALTRMARESPALAKRLVDQRDRENQRENVSYRFGVVAACFLVSVVLGGTFFALVYAGFWATMGLIGVALASAVLIRVVLTGEWSDTSWFGSLVHALARALGSRDVDDSDNAG